MQEITEAPVNEPPPGFTPIGVNVEGASRVFRSRRGDVQALHGMDLRAAPGQTVAVVGASGCGKSTLLELICGLQRPDAGSVASDPAVLMPQRDLLLPWASALDNAALALRARGVGRAQARAQALPWFERFGLAGFQDSRPAALSGGMRQRVAFMRTLLAGKPVLALDEPFAALDALTRQEMQAWLGQALEREPRTVVLVTHDVEEAILLGDRVVVMSPRPGRAVLSLEIALPRPRRRADPAVVELRERAMLALSARSPSAGAPAAPGPPAAPPRDPEAPA